MPAPELARPAQFDRSSQHRRAMIAKVNVARHQLSMVEDDYRQLLFDTTGQTSLKTCSDAQLERMIGALKDKGFRPLPKAGGKPAAQHPMARKARALWISLHHLGAVRNPSEEALEAFAKRQLGCEKLVWARQSDAYRLIEALKAMAKRAGWLQNDPATGKPLPVQRLQLHLCEVILGKLKLAEAIPTAWTIDLAAWRLCGIETRRDRPFEVEDYARLAKALGDELRRLAPQDAEA